MRVYLLIEQHDLTLPVFLFMGLRVVRCEELLIVLHYTLQVLLPVRILIQLFTAFEHSWDPRLPPRACGLSLDVFSCWLFGLEKCHYHLLRCKFGLKVEYSCS